jgi:hypothetical protein
MRRAAIDDIIGLLDKHRQRATYGAVAGLVGGTATSLMKGRPRCPLNSWVVAGSTGVFKSRSGVKIRRRAGYPTGYHDDEIHPSLHGHDTIIGNAEELQQWIQKKRDA